MDRSADWMVDLVSDDDGARAAAWGRQEAAWKAWHQALRRLNSAWFASNEPYPLTGRLGRKAAAAHEAMQAALAQTIQGRAVHDSWRTDIVGHERAQLDRFAVLFLRCEDERLTELRGGAWSVWGTKKSVLRRLARHGVAPAEHDGLLDLTMRAFARHQRCEDQGYARVLRVVDPEAARAGLLAVLAGASDDVVARRASYGLALLDDPGLHVTRRAWLTFDHGPDRPV